MKANVACFGGRHVYLGREAPVQGDFVGWGECQVKICNVVKMSYLTLLPMERQWLQTV